MINELSKPLQRRLIKNKKYLIALVSIISVIILFTVLVLTHVICLWHNYSDATVIEPQTCYYCGKTKGEPKPLSEIEFPTKGLAALLPIPKSNMGEIEWDSSDSVYIYIGNTTKDDFNNYIKDCSNIGFDVNYQKGEDYYYADDKSGNRLNLNYNMNNIMSIQILAPYEEEKITTDTENTDSKISFATSTNDDKNSSYKSIVHSDIKGRKFTKFQTKYEESLVPILKEKSLNLIKIEYMPLVPDYDLDYYEIDRINEYDVKVYVTGTMNSYKEIYDTIIDIRCANNYLLSNKYEILSSGAYVDDDCKEKGFHQVTTILVFDDNTEYRVDFRSLLKNNESVYKQDGSSGGSPNVYPYGDECGYPECDHNRAEGKPYCHQHKCAESGCNNSTGLLPDYCDEHNCTYGSCSAPRYKAVGSTYCQRHYIETN